MSELEAGNGANDDIIIKAGHSHAIPIHLDAPGIILCWEFASAPKVHVLISSFQFPYLMPFMTKINIYIMFPFNPSFRAPWPTWLICVFMAHVGIYCHKWPTQRM